LKQSNCTHEHFTLDPSNEKIFELVEGVLMEVGKMFPDKYFHLGGDEVIMFCGNLSLWFFI
jgi:N-acetyl-beta-hexosaminidase